MEPWQIHLNILSWKSLRPWAILCTHLDFSWDPLKSIEMYINYGTYTKLGQMWGQSSGAYVQWGSMGVPPPGLDHRDMALWLALLCLTSTYVSLVWRHTKLGLIVHDVMLDIVRPIKFGEMKTEVTCDNSTNFGDNHLDILISVDLQTWTSHF